MSQQVKFDLRLDGKVAVVGSANADLTVRTQHLPQAGQTVFGGPLLTMPGGKSANQAAAASLLGTITSFVGAVGQDAHGDFLRKALSGVGVDVAGVSVVSAPTSTAIVAVDNAGENTIIVTDGANNEVNRELVRSARATIAEADVLGLAMEVPLPAVMEAAEVAAASSTLVVLNPSPMPEAFPEGLLNNVDVLIVNEGELEELLGRPLGTWQDAEAELRQLGVSTCVVTLGGAGAVVLSQGPTVIAPTPVDAVDTTGCGDSFTGALMSALAGGATLVDSASFASVVAAYAATGEGAQSSYGTLQQIAAYFGLGAQRSPS